MGTLLQSDAGYLFALDNDVIMNEPNESLHSWILFDFI